MTREIPQYAIFDMDGTLLDSMRQWRNGWYEYCIAQGILSAEDAVDLKGVTWSRGAEIVKERYGVDLLVPEHIKGMFDVILEHYKTDVTPYYNVIERLHAIVKNGGKAVLLTATPHPWCDEAMRIFGLTDCFTALLTPDENGGVGKQDPSAFRLALSHLGCDDPAECMVYEDAYYSIRVAASMGFRITAILDPTAEPEREQILPLVCDTIEPRAGRKGERFPYRCALFDMDGTLLDSMPGLVRGYHTVLTAALPPEYHRDVDFFAPFACYEAREAFRRISEALGVSLDADVLIVDLLREAERRYRAYVRPYPEMLRRLKALKEDGVQLGVITATPHPLCDIAVEATGLSEYISLVMTPEDNGGIGKRDPSIFRLALGKLGCDDPSRAAMYEDAVYSLGTAKGLGMYSVAVLDRMASASHASLCELADEVIFPTPSSLPG